MTTWQDILQQQSQITACAPSDSTSFAPLPQLGVLTVSGDDAQSFLQSLLTNDVAALNVNQSQLTGFCNAKGRLFALFLLIRREQHYQIILPGSMTTLLKQRLSMYVLRAKVTITDDSEQLAIASFANITPDKLAQLEVSDADSQTLPNGQCLCIINRDDTAQLLSNIEQAGYVLVSEKTWNIAAIEAGIPMVFPETKEKFTPQQVNLDLVDGVSFKKGCYPGQEVVARLHYLGSPNRRLFKAELGDNVFPDIGSEVRTENGDVAGHIVCAELTTATSIVLLVSLKLSAVETQLQTESSQTITLLSRDIPE